jgi:hypothetical protein
MTLVAQQAGDERQQPEPANLIDEIKKRLADDPEPGTATSDPAPEQQEQPVMEDPDPAPDLQSCVSEASFPQIADIIRRALCGNAHSKVLIGRWARQARDRIQGPEGKALGLVWSHWCEAEFGKSRSTVERYMIQAGDIRGDRQREAKYKEKLEETAALRQLTEEKRKSLLDAERPARRLSRRGRWWRLLRRRPLRGVIRRHHPSLSYKPPSKR